MTDKEFIQLVERNLYELVQARDALRARRTEQQWEHADGIQEIIAAITLRQQGEKL